MSEWRKRELGELLAAAGGYVRTGPFGSQLHAHEYTDDPFGIPVVMPKDMVHGRVDRRSVSRVDHQTAERLKVHRLAAGDVVLARRGDVGRFAAVADDEAGWLCGTGSMRVHAPDHEVLCSGFLRHAMSHPDVGEWLAGQAVGATMPNLNAEIVSRLPLFVPLVATQRRVAALLSAFDELIEINERRIELLEDFARSLYREWFVRFRFPNHENAAFVDSDLGSIPAGWEVASLGDVANPNARAWKAHELPDPFLYLDISCVAEGRVNEPIPTALERAPGRARRVVRDGDVVWSTVRPNRRAHAVVHDPPENLVASTGLAVLSPERVPSSFLFGYASRLEFTEYLVGRATGSAYPAVKPSDFEEAPIVLPPSRFLDEFDLAADPALRLISALLGQNGRLSQTRDRLLPRLVTGRLDIADVDLGDLLPTQRE